MPIGSSEGDYFETPFDMIAGDFQAINAQNTYQESQGTDPLLHSNLGTYQATGVWDNSEPPMLAKGDRLDQLEYGVAKGDRLDQISQPIEASMGPSPTAEEPSAKTKVTVHPSNTLYQQIESVQPDWLTNAGKILQAAHEKQFGPAPSNFQDFVKDVVPNLLQSLNFIGGGFQRAIPQPATRVLTTFSGGRGSPGINTIGTEGNAVMNARSGRALIPGGTAANDNAAFADFNLDPKAAADLEKRLNALADLNQGPGKQITTDEFQYQLSLNEQKAKANQKTNFKVIEGVKSPGGSPEPTTPQTHKSAANFESPEWTPKEKQALQDFLSNGGDPAEFSGTRTEQSVRKMANNLGIPVQKVNDAFSFFTPTKIGGTSIPDPQKLKQLDQMLGQGLSFTQIGKVFGVSRNTVAGAVSRFRNKGLLEN